METTEKTISPTELYFKIVIKANESEINRLEIERVELMRSLKRLKVLNVAISIATIVGVLILIFIKL